MVGAHGLRDELIKLKDDKDSLNSFLKQNKSHLSDVIKTSYTSSQFFTLVQTILKGLPNNADDDESEIKRSVLTVLIDACAFGSISFNLSNEVSALISMEVAKLSCESLVLLVHHVKSVVESPHGKLSSGSWLTLLPRILGVLSSKEFVQDNDKSFTGSQYHAVMLDSVVGWKWSPGNAVHVCAILKDTTISADALIRLIKRICESWKKLRYVDIPPLVYQCLLLCRHGNGSLLLYSLSEFYNSEVDSLASTDSEDSIFPADRGALSDLQHSGSSVIYYITSATSMGHTIVKEVQKILKSACTVPGETMTTFLLALSLSLASVPAFRVSICENVRLVLIKAIKLKYHIVTSKWLEEIVSNQLSINTMMKDLIDNYISNWDSVSDSLVEVAFSLLGYSSVLKSDAELVSEIHHLATGALIRIVRKKPDAMNVILKCLGTKIPVEQKDQHVWLLLRLVSTNPGLVLENLNLVQEILDSLPHLPFRVSSLVISAIQPMLKLSPKLRDKLFLILRKSLFSRSIDCRRLSVFGLLLLLKQYHSLNALPSSQCSQYSQTLMQSQIEVTVLSHTVHDSGCNDAVLLEILGILRRCFLHQPVVVVFLFRGLSEIISEKDEMASRILEFLMPELRRLLNDNSSAVNPLVLDSVIKVANEGLVVSPVAHLLSCVVACNAKCLFNDDQIVNKEIFEECDAKLKQLLQRLLSADLETLGLFDNDDLDFEGGYERKYVLSQSHICAITVLMVHLLLRDDWSISAESATSIKTLLNLKKDILESIKETPSFTNKGKKGAGKKKKADENNADATAMNRPRPTKSKVSEDYGFLFKNIFSMDLEYRFLTYMLTRRDELPAELMAEEDFVKLPVILATERLKTFEKETPCISHVQLLCSELFSYMSQQITLLSEERDKKLMPALLDNLMKCLVLLYQHSYVGLVKTLKDLTDETKEDGCMGKFVTFLLGSIGCCIEDGLDPQLTFSIVDFILVLLKKLSRGCPALDSLVEWLKNTVQRTDITNGIVVKEIFHLLVFLTQKMKGNVPLIRDIARQLHSQLGDTEEDVEVEQCVAYKIMNEELAEHVVPMVISGLELVLHDIDYALEYCKVLLSLYSDFNMVFSDGPRGLKSREKTICGRFGVVVTALHELVQTALPVGITLENALRILVHVYDSLTNFVKYYLEVFKKGKIPELESRFEKLVRLTGGHLTQHAYTFVNYCEGNQVSEQEGKKIPSGVKAKVLRNSQKITSLIFAIEQYENHLIKLSKKSSVDLMANMKPSTARDFRINADVIAQALVDQDNDAVDASHSIVSERDLDTEDLEEAADNIEESPTREVDMDIDSTESPEASPKLKRAKMKLGKRF